MSQVSYENLPMSAESNRRFPQMAVWATADWLQRIMGIKRTSADNQWRHLFLYVLFIYVSTRRNDERKMDYSNDDSSMSTIVKQNN